MTPPPTIPYIIREDRAKSGTWSIWFPTLPGSCLDPSKVDTCAGDGHGAGTYAGYLKATRPAKDPARGLALQHLEGHILREEITSEAAAQMYEVKRWSGRFDKMRRAEFLRMRRQTAP